MVRSVEADFGHLAQFVHGYSLAMLITDEAYRAYLKQGHREYLILLTLWAEIEYESANAPVAIAGAKLEAGSTNFDLLKESVSDFGSAYFCCIHGLYKPGHMALRSNIENFVRSISGLQEASALTTRSIYKLFDIAKTQPVFSGSGAHYLTNLQQAYKELCKFSHSASLTHMAHIGSLQHFPAFNNSAFRKWGTYAKKIMKNEVSCLLHLNPKLYTHSHYKLKEILDIGFLDATVRLEVLGGK